MTAARSVCGAPGIWSPRLRTDLEADRKHRQQAHLLFLDRQPRGNLAVDHGMRRKLRGRRLGESNRLSNRRTSKRVLRLKMAVFGAGDRLAEDFSHPAGQFRGGSSLRAPGPIWARDSASFDLRGMRFPMGCSRIGRGSATLLRDFAVRKWPAFSRSSENGHVAEFEQARAATMEHPNFPNPSPRPQRNVPRGNLVRKSQAGTSQNVQPAGLF